MSSTSLPHNLGEWQAEQKDPKIPWRKLWSQNHRAHGGHCTEGSDGIYWPQVKDSMLPPPFL